MDEIGDFNFSRGDYNAAFRSYLRTQDYIQQNEVALRLNMYLQMIRFLNFYYPFNLILIISYRVSIAVNNWPHVISNAQKAEVDCKGQPNEREIKVEAKTAQAIALLATKKFSSAADYFKSIDFYAIDQSKPSSLISPQDIALYGGLCALSEYNRQSLKSLIENSNFKMFLQLVPNVQRMINDFYNSKYASCLAELEILKVYYSILPHLFILERSWTGLLFT